MNTVVVAGSVHYRAYFQFARMLDDALQHYRGPLTIIDSGGPGVAYLAYLYALRRGILSVTIVPDWDTYERQAGYIHARETLDKATLLITIWDGRTPETRPLVNTASESARLTHRQFTIPEVPNGKEQKESHCRWREINRRTLAKYRKRRAIARLMGQSD